MVYFPENKSIHAKKQSLTKKPQPSHKIIQQKLYRSMTATETSVAELTGENIEVENIYDEIEIDDMDWDEELRSFLYPCPCGDKFRISLD